MRVIVLLFIIIKFSMKRELNDSHSNGTLDRRAEEYSVRPDIDSWLDSFTCWYILLEEVK